MQLSSGGYVASVRPPLIDSGFVYLYDPDKDPVSDDGNGFAFCHADKLMSNDVATRILAALIWKRQRESGDSSSASTSPHCSCDFGRVGRIRYFNEYRLPSPFYQVWKGSSITGTR